MADHRPKSRPDKTTNTRAEDDSITKASISGESAYEYVSGVRKPIGIRVDTGLYSAFKPVAKRLYGSVCHALEIYMSALILTAENPASICYTSGKAIRIEKIVIERNLRSRRNLEIVEDIEGLSREQAKEQELLRDKEKLFKMVFDQWALHSSREWRLIWSRKAERWKSKVRSAELVYDLGKELAEGAGNG